MPRLTPPLAAIWIFAVLASAPAFGQPTALERLQHSLAAQDDLLAHDDRGPEWDTYLLTAQLRAQVELGSSADADVLRQILTKYEAREPGLRTTQFASTRAALAAWHRELAQPPATDKPALASDAKMRYRPIDKADVLSRQVAVEAAVRRLDRYLKNSGANGAGWRNHLQFAAMQADLAKGLEANPAELRTIAKQYFSGDAGLELAPFAGMGLALQNYANYLEAFQDGEGKQNYQSTLDALADDLRAGAAKPADIDRNKLGAALGQLAAANQAKELVTAVRQQYAQPNLLVRVSNYVVTAGIGDDVDELTPVSDNILGTSISGQGRTRGQVSAVMVPNDDRATLEIRLSGNTHANTVGRNGPATIFASSNTSLLGRKLINISDEGFFSAPAHAQCCTNSNIESICVNGCKIVQRIATKRVYANKGTAEVISARHAETRLENRMNTRTGGLLENVNRNYHERFRNPLVRKGAFPQQLDFSTSADWLSVVGLMARDNQLGATTPAPQPADNAELSIRIHESMLENMAAAMLAGQISRNEEFQRLLRNLRGGKFNEEEFRAFLRGLRDDKEPYDDFNSLLVDRFERTLTSAEFAALVQAVKAKMVTATQAKDYLSPFAEKPYTTEEINSLLDNLPEESQASMTFAAENPVQVRFREGGVILTLRAASYVSANGLEKSVPMDITAAYQLTLKGDQLVATRKGDLELAPPGFKPGVDKLSAEQTGARGTLRRRFEEIFKPEFTSSGLTLRGRWKKLGELPWTQIDSQDGWLAAGWKRGTEQNSTE